MAYERGGVRARWCRGKVANAKGGKKVAQGTRTEVKWHWGEVAKALDASPPPSPSPSHMLWRNEDTECSPVCKG